MIAFTFGEGNTPADGGTLNTWNQCHAKIKIHISLKDVKEGKDFQALQESENNNDEFDEFWNPTIKKSKPNIFDLNMSELEDEKKSYLELESNLPEGLWVAVRDGQIIAKDLVKEKALLMARQSAGLNLFYFTQVTHKSSVDSKVSNNNENNKRKSLECVEVLDEKFQKVDE
jgi:hypothetical protein